MLRGVDVSSYQSLATVEAELPRVRFGFVKATEGAGYVNPIHREQLRLFQHAGKPAGLYHFLVHDVDPVRQWLHFREHVAPHRGSVILAVDHERDLHGVVPSDALVRRFVKAAHRDHYRVGRYASLSIFERGQVGADWRWVALWNPEPPKIKWRFWQQSGSGHMDVDVFDGTIVELRAFWRQNVWRGRRRLILPGH